jgi:hypothetical protein
VSFNNDSDPLVSQQVTSFNVQKSVPAASLKGTGIAAKHPPAYDLNICPPVQTQNSDQADPLLAGGPPVLADGANARQRVEGVKVNEAVSGA